MKFSSLAAGCTLILLHHCAGQAQGGSAWRKVFGAPSAERASDISWLQFVKDCGSRAIRANETMSKQAFNATYVGRVVEWEGTVLGIGSLVAAVGDEEGREEFEVLVKMDPTDAWRHDVALLAPSSLREEVVQLSTLQRVRFQGELLRFGGRWGTHVLRVRSLSLLNPATAAAVNAEAEGVAGHEHDGHEQAAVVDNDDRSWDTFRVECGSAARKANSIRAANAFARRFAGQQVTWSGRVFGVRSSAVPEDGPAPQLPEGATGSNYVIFKVRMEPSDSWLYDVIVQAPRTIVTDQPETKDYITFTGAFRPLATQDLQVRTETYVDAQVVVSLSHRAVTKAERKDEL